MKKYILPLLFIGCKAQPDSFQTQLMQRDREIDSLKIELKNYQILHSLSKIEIDKDSSFYKALPIILFYSHYFFI
jgi:hypothetical protein